MTEHLLTILAITIPVLLVVSVGIFKYFQNIKRCLDKADKRTFRISKALVVLANRLDDIYKETHLKELNLGPEVETILKDSHGHF